MIWYISSPEFCELLMGETLPNRQQTSIAKLSNRQQIVQAQKTPRFQRGNRFLLDYRRIGEGLAATISCLRVVRCLIITVFAIAPLMFMIVMYVRMVPSSVAQA